MSGYSCLAFRWFSPIISKLNILFLGKRWKDYNTSTCGRKIVNNSYENIGWRFSSIEFFKCMLFKEQNTFRIHQPRWRKSTHDRTDRSQRRQQENCPFFPTEHKPTWSLDRTPSVPHHVRYHRGYREHEQHIPSPLVYFACSFVRWWYFFVFNICLPIRTDNIIIVQRPPAFAVLHFCTPGGNLVPGGYAPLIPRRVPWVLSNR